VKSVVPPLVSTIVCYCGDAKREEVGLGDAFARTCRTEDQERTVKHCESVAQVVVGDVIVSIRQCAQETIKRLERNPKGRKHFEIVENDRSEGEHLLLVE
jgi:hypothetical protein